MPNINRREPHITRTARDDESVNFKRFDEDRAGISEKSAASDVTSEIDSRHKNTAFEVNS